MSTVFLGTSDFAAAILERLASSGAHAPALVLTRPDRPSGRGRRLTSPPVAEKARALGVALEQPKSVNDPEVLEQIGLLAPEKVVVCAFGALIREPLLSEHELLNVHPSLLPRWRGAAPIERAIMAGDERTGVSIMRVTAGLDSGPVYLAASEPILPGDTYGSLAPRLQALGGELLMRVLEEAPAFTEQASEGVTYAEKIGPADRLLDPTGSAVEQERIVRALHPHIGAHVALADGALLGVQRATLADAGSIGEAGVGVTARDGRLLLVCARGALELREVQPAGGQTMDAPAFLRGHGLPNDRGNPPAASRSGSFSGRPPGPSEGARVPPTPPPATSRRPTG